MANWTRKASKYMLPEWSDRLRFWIETLKKDFYIPLGNIPVEGFLTMEHLPLEEAKKGTFAPMPVGTAWGRTYEYCWMRGSVTIPEAAAGKWVAMNLVTGGEATVFVDGKSFGTYRADWVREPHHYICDNYLTTCAEAGRTYEIMLEAYAGHYYPGMENGGCATGPVLPGSYIDPKTEGQRATLGNLTYGIWNEDAYQLYMDAVTLTSLLQNIDQESLRADKLSEALEKFTLAVDFEQPIEGRITDYRAAREILKPALAAGNGTTAPKFYAIGNSHLDLAWLWPMHETHRKTSRTFAAQLRLLEQYPDYVFLQSQPASYEMCREHYPELYERILQAIREGRWIAEGAMWVEPDTNMTSGESLVRQLIHGKRYFKDVLGVDSVVLWLPDTFGYSAALPQLLKSCGVKYLVTQKIFWSYNEGEKFPYHYFTWQGADGSKIDTFLPTSYTYYTDPAQVADVWNNRVQKRGLDAFMLPYGYGDGGGGPAREHIEYLCREKDLEGMPRVEMTSPVRFFEDMERGGGPQHTYVGELYFSAHRGVYTTQAAIKRGNRKGELALREAEMWGALAMLRGAEYPMQKMDALWKLLLLNQFHDILPGSSIAAVYEKARREHAQIIADADAVCDQALQALCGGEGATVFNSLSFDRTGIVCLPDAFADGAVTSDGAFVPVSKGADGVLAYVTVPACGSVALLPAKAQTPVPKACARLTDGKAILENDLVRVELNDRAEVVSFVEKATGREYADGAMNRLSMFKDVPRLFDGWDIDSNYELQPVAIDEPVTLTVKETDGLRAVIHMERKLHNSTFAQDIVLDAGSRRVEFVTHVSWHELHRLLKVSFPIRVETSEAINEIQFGYMTRPTHRSRLYDSDRFEVCNQRYSALCDAGHGAALINDCKYGIANDGNALRLTLLRAAACPDMPSDQGEHDFTYAFTAWEGPFAQCDVVRQAYEVNVPMQVRPGSGAIESAFRVDAPNVFIDTVKPAEDGSGDVILRMYEAKRADTDCRLTIGIPFKKVAVCNMLEEITEEPTVTDNVVALHFGTFEVKTLRLSVK